MEESTDASSGLPLSGVMFSVMLGLWVLLLAEVFHYVIHYQVPLRDVVAGLTFR